MRKLSFLSLIFIITIGFTACSEDPIVLEPVASETVTNLHAPQNGGQGQGPVSGEFTLFDFETGAQTTDANAWDIGFRGTTIIVNGGESQGTTDEPERTGTAAGYFTTGGFASVLVADETQLNQDSATELAIPNGSGNGWYNYNPMLNAITPITGVVLVFRTTEGNFAKVEIESYYKDKDASNPANGRYYTFNYVYNPNVGDRSFE